MNREITLTSGTTGTNTALSHTDPLGRFGATGWGASFEKSFKTKNMGWNESYSLRLLLEEWYNLVLMHVLFNKGTVIEGMKEGAGWGGGCFGVPLALAKVSTQCAWNDSAHSPSLTLNAGLGSSGLKNRAFHRQMTGMTRYAHYCTIGFLQRRWTERWSSTWT